MRYAPLEDAAVRLFQRIEAGHAQNGVGLALQRVLGHRGHPFGDCDPIAQMLGPFLHIADPARAAVRAHPFPAVECRRAGLRRTQALGKQQQPFFEGHIGESVRPPGVA